jgi:zinc transport system substrate-binding protein
MNAQTRSAAGRITLRLLPLGLVLVALAVFLLLGGPRATGERPLLAAATVPPQGWLLERLGGDRLTVDVLLPPGADVHTYEPTPQQVERLARARLVLAVGHPGLPLEAHLLDAAAGARPAPAIVTMAAQARALDLALPADDPHLWLAPAVMAATAQAAATELARLDPAGAPHYERRLAALLAEIAAVDDEVRRRLAGASRRAFLVYHPSWGCFGSQYGLEQVAIEADGKEPSARQLVALVEQARRDGTRAVFVQQGVADRPARVLAEEIGAAVVPLDAMSADWPAAVLAAAASLGEALRG